MAELEHLGKAIPAEMAQNQQVHTICRAVEVALVLLVERLLKARLAVVLAGTVHLHL